MPMKKVLLLLTSTTLLVLPLLAYAQTSAYRPLIQLPITTGGAPGWQGYIDLLYATAISLAALLAVMKIVIAGAKYMFSDVITNKAEAKNDIQGALLGLLLILGAVILLNLINPQLTNTTINIDRIQPTPKIPPAPVAAAAPPPGVPGGKPAPVVPGGKPAVPPTPAPRGTETNAKFTSAPGATKTSAGAYDTYTATFPGDITSVTGKAALRAFQKECTLKQGVNHREQNSNVATCKLDRTNLGG